VSISDPTDPLHHGRVLIVEDDPDQAAILELVLRAEGLDVVSAASGEQALEMHHRAPADVVVTDLNLPEMTGVELLRRMSESGVIHERGQTGPPTPAFVVVTGQRTATGGVELLQVGVAEYLQKPLDQARLVSLVRELLARKKVRGFHGEARGQCALPVADPLGSPPWSGTPLRDEKH
jgi:CheY-like chemotaxis protein